MASKGLAAAFGEAVRDLREELITRGWFGRNPSAAGSHEHHATQVDARGQSVSVHLDHSMSVQLDRSLSVQLGWNFPQEPTRDRPGQEIDRPGEDIER